MSSFISCPECKRKLKVPESMVGKAFRCPACKAIIESESEEDTPPPSRAVKTTPAPRSAVALPRSRPPRNEEPEDDFDPEEEEPVREKPRRKKRPIRKQPSSGLIIGLVVGGAVLLLLVLGGGGGLLWYFLRHKGIAEADWQTFAPTGRDCSVLMPGQPQPQTIHMLGIDVTQYTVLRKNGSEAFAVAFYDIPQNLLRPSLLEEMAKGSRDGAMNNMGGGKATNETPISLGNVPGREYQIKPVIGRGTLIGRIYLAKIGKIHRAYLLMVGGDSIQPNTGDAARFLESFQITGPAEAPDLGGAAAGGRLQPPAMNPQPNLPRPNMPGGRPRGPRRPF